MTLMINIELREFPRSRVLVSSSLHACLQEGTQNSQRCRDPAQQPETLDLGLLDSHDGVSSKKGTSGWASLNEPLHVSSTLFGDVREK